MAKEIKAYIGGAIQTVITVPLCVGGVIKEAKEGYAGISGVVTKFFSSIPYLISYWKSTTDDDNNRYYFSDYYCGVKNGDLYVFAKAQERQSYSSDRELSIGISIKKLETLSGKTISFDYEIEGHEYGRRTAKYYEFDDADLSGADNATCDMDIGESTGTFTRVIGNGHSKEIEKIWLNLWFNNSSVNSSVPFHLTIKNLKIGDVDLSEYFTTDITI